MLQKRDQERDRYKCEPYLAKMPPEPRVMPKPEPNTVGCETSGEMARISERQKRADKTKA